MSEAVETAEVTSVEVILDPFSFHDGVASRIAGLGGDKASADLTYAFHTPYVEAAAGPCNFTVRFSRLTAKYGTLQLRVHMIALKPGSIATMANMDRIALNRLVQYGGELSIKFEGFQGYGFALIGLIAGDTDARADSLVVALDRPAVPDSRELSSDGRPSAYGSDATRHIAQLISIAPPSFASPVTQICTRSQLIEPAFADWRQRLDRASCSDLTLWTEAFVLQALRRYGMLTAGARGIGLGVSDRVLPGIMTDFGSDITLANVPGEGGIEGGEGSLLVEQELALEPFSKELIDYDFAFSTGLLVRAGSSQERMSLFEQSMNCLRAGGLMIHTAPIDLGIEMAHLRASHGAFGRGDIERMALVAISHNHEVAQIKIGRAGALLDPGCSGEIGAFGMILRRASSIL